MSKFTAAQLVELANGIYSGAELEHLTDSGWTVLGTKAETVDALLHSWRIKPTKLERLEKNVVDAKAAADSYDYDDDAFYAAALVAYAKARDELTEYRNYKKAQLIQQLAKIVIRHDIETT